ncbi:MAG: helix-turn-helix transcriptional regulator [Pseudomonadota bacterium]
MPFEKNLNNTLEYLIKERGINTHQLHKHTGIPLSTLKRLRLNKEHNPTLASLLPIAKYFKVTVDQLIGSNSLKIKTSSSNEITIPIIYWKDALHCKKERYKQAFSFLLINDTSLSRDSYALIIEGHQWSNFLAGSLLIIDPHLDPSNRDFIIAQKEQHLPQLHQVLIFTNKRYLKLSDYKSEIVLFTNKYKNLGVVTQIRMNYKKNRQYVNFKDKKPSYFTKEY